MLLRNLEPTILCNGTRLIVCDHVIDHINDNNRGNDVYIPKFPLYSEKFDFNLRKL